VGESSGQHLWLSAVVSGCQGSGQQYAKGHFYPAFPRTPIHTPLLAPAVMHHHRDGPHPHTIPAASAVALSSYIRQAGKYANEKNFQEIQRLAEDIHICKIKIHLFVLACSIYSIIVPKNITFSEGTLKRGQFGHFH
jgi:hypothetical protein